MLRSFEFIVCRFVMSMRPDEQGCKRYLATPIELREVSGATNACVFYHGASKSAPFSGSGRATGASGMCEFRAG
jgi:hypothetical protein